MALLRQRIERIFENFDKVPKEDLARELVEVLQLQGGERLISLLQSALGRQLTREELFKAEALAVLLADFRGGDPTKWGDF